MHEVDYPFVRDKYTAWDDDGAVTAESWRPGTKRIPDPRSGWIECEMTIAHAMGKMLLTEVKRVEMPGRLATRVFYQRHWRDPDGREFGKRTLRVTTANAFTRMLSGYRYSYRMQDSDNG